MSFIPGSLVLLVTGGRDYSDVETVHRTLAMVQPYRRIDVFHGACPTGADKIAVDFFMHTLQHPNLELHAYPADWQTHGKSAGPKRNQQMVDAVVQYRSPNCRIVCLAYWDGESKGTFDCFKRAVKAGIETGVIPPDPAGVRV